MGDVTDGVKNVLGTGTRIGRDRHSLVVVI